MEEVAPDIFMIQEHGSYGAIKPTVNSYIIAGNDGLVYDAGYGNAGSVRRFIEEFRKIERTMNQKGGDFRVRRILPSHVHPDHFSGLVSLKKRLDFSILLTPLMHGIISSRKAYRSSYYFRGDAFFRNGQSPLNRVWDLTIRPVISFLYEGLYGTRFVEAPDVLIEAESEIEINGRCWKIFPSPGHSTDHISLYDPERGILFSGDNVLRSVTTWLGPPKSNLSDYITSLRKMLALPKLDLILSAHGSPVSNPRERIREIIDWRESRTEQLLELVRDHGNGGVTLKELLTRLYEREGWLKHRIAEGWVMVTLDHLVARSFVERRSSAGEIRFVSVR